MASRNQSEEGSSSSREKPARQGSPDWADGLRQFYDSVVDEPLPDSFKDLLDKLDEGQENSTTHNSNADDGSSYLAGKA
ncbi:MAG: NepR family anti-sigma factor [Erythrobacter sp.]